jgi:hypothetical protein
VRISGPFYGSYPVFSFGPDVRVRLDCGRDLHPTQWGGPLIVRKDAICPSAVLHSSHPTVTSFHIMNSLDREILEVEAGMIESTRQQACQNGDGDRMKNTGTNYCN